MNSSVECALDPLDLEIVERALEGVSEAVRNESLAERESDEGLRAALRRELIQLVRSSGISDPDALRDILVVNMTEGGVNNKGCELISVVPQRRHATKATLPKLSDVARACGAALPYVSRHLRR